MLARLALTLLTAHGVRCLASPVQRQPGLSPGAPRAVYIIGGQSNAAGQGLTGELTDEERRSVKAVGSRVTVVYPSVRTKSADEFKELEQLKLDADLLDPENPQNYSRLEQRSTPFGKAVDGDPRIRPSTSTLDDIAHGLKGTLGPEVGFGLTMAEAFPDQAITILKVVWPGINITDYRRLLYPILISSLHKLEQDHGKLDLRGVIWVHGESACCTIYHHNWWSTMETVSRA